MLMSIKPYKRIVLKDELKITKIDIIIYIYIYIYLKNKRDKKK
jgi:hypothetical protein